MHHDLVSKLLKQCDIESLKITQRTEQSGEWEAVTVRWECDDREKACYDGRLAHIRMQRASLGR